MHDTPAHRRAWAPTQLPTIGPPIPGRAHCGSWHFRDTHTVYAVMHSCRSPLARPFHPAHRFVAVPSFKETRQAVTSLVWGIRRAVNFRKRRSDRDCAPPPGEAASTSRGMTLTSISVEPGTNKRKTGAPGHDLPSVDETDYGCAARKRRNGGNVCLQPRGCCTLHGWPYMLPPADGQLSCNAHRPPARAHRGLWLLRAAACKPGSWGHPAWPPPAAA